MLQGQFGFKFRQPLTRLQRRSSPGWRGSSSSFVIAASVCPDLGGENNSQPQCAERSGLGSNQVHISSTIAPQPGRALTRATVQQVSSAALTYPPQFTIAATEVRLYDLLGWLKPAADGACDSRTRLDHEEPMSGADSRFKDQATSDRAAHLLGPILTLALVGSLLDGAKGAIGGATVAIGAETSARLYPFIKRLRGPSDAEPDR